LDPILLRDIAIALSKLVPVDSEVLAGLEMGDIHIVTQLSQVTRSRRALVKKKAKYHGVNSIFKVRICMIKEFF
jgi:orotate phosphoribosyltransferase